MLHCDRVNNEDTYFTQNTVDPHVSNGGTYAVQSVNNESTYPICGAALHRCAPIWEFCALNWCIHHGPATAPGQPLIKQALCIVIQQHHTLSAWPGQGYDVPWAAVGWLSAEQVNSVKGKDAGKVFEICKHIFWFWFPIVPLSHKIFGPRNIKYERQWLQITVCYAQTK